MVKREQVYSPSSASVTSLMLIVSSCDVARTSSIRLSLSAAGTNNQESIINYDTFISICHTLKSGGFSVTFPLFLKVLMHGYWPKDETWKILLPKNYTFNQKKIINNNKKEHIILWLCSHIVLRMKINSIATGKKIYISWWLSVRGQMEYGSVKIQIQHHFSE